MKEVILRLEPSLPERTKEEISVLLDKEVESFSRYMSILGDWKTVGALTPSEKALIKTYLVQKLTGKVDGA